MENKRLKKLGLPLRLALVIIIYGALFKVMHWPYAQQLMLIGSILVALLYCIRFLLKINKVQLDYVKLALVLFWFLSYSNTAFHLIDLPYVLDIIVFVLFCWWFIKEGLSYFSKRQFKGNNVLKFFYYGILVISILLIIIGILFKIQRWPFGNIMFTFGVISSSLILILDYFMIKQKTSK
ncbi:GldL-related protein [Psychroserpens sp. S379A]|uniref:GldL-related protein n=1 Tax=Psychroserpens sp. S379A TaxID=3415137 RepID=UPI003C7E10FC